MVDAVLDVSMVDDNAKSPFLADLCLSQIDLVNYFPTSDLQCSAHVFSLEVGVISELELDVLCFEFRIQR